MCGITGIIQIEEGVDHDLLQQMTDSISHRGPDDQGVWLSEPFFVQGIKCQVGLGHRRLSIIDLSKNANQPMCNEDRTIWIVYNGEFYNYQEHRKYLERKGHRFRSRSDTEVIIHLYEEDGVECVQKMNGMWAFALWDQKRKMVFLSRDRVGKKPLYYYTGKNRFYFASELKAILTDRNISRDIDEESLLKYLMYGYIPSPGTIFRNISKLNPGHNMVISMEKTISFYSLKQKKYWDVLFEPDYSIPEKSWIDALRELIFDAVKLRLVSDVPLGAFLSGGLDSSIVVGVMAKLMARPVQTFSIGFLEEQYNELIYADLVAKFNKTDHAYEVVTHKGMDMLPDVIRANDEPLADSSCIPTYCVSRLARKKVKVVLSGDGGDELFGGYYNYWYIYRFQKYDRLPKIIKCIFKKMADLLPTGSRGKWRLYELGLDSNTRFLKCVLQSSPESIKQLISGGQLDKYFSLDKPLFSKARNKGRLSSFLEFDFKQLLPQDILTKVDRASMRHSLEVRTPLLDYRIVELAARIPIEYKLRNGTGKYILKEAFRDLLPRDLPTERKQGFVLPVRVWIAEGLMNTLKNQLLSENTFFNVYFNENFLKKIMSQKKPHPWQVDYTNLIWNLIVLEKWRGIYLNPTGY